MADAPATLARLAEDAQRRLGDRTTLLFEGRWYRSGELHERACRLSGGLASLGIAPGDRVAVVMTNSPEISICYSALWRAGAIVTPVVFLLSAAELRSILADSGARAVLTSPELLPKVREAAEGLPELRWIVVQDSSSEPASPPEAGTIALSELEAAAPGPIVPRLPSDLAALLYTGGTTGRAKGVMLSHDNLAFAAGATRAASHVEGRKRSLLPLPLSHAFGLMVTIAGYFSEDPDGFSVLQRWFEPASFLSLVQEHRVQSAPVVPSMLQALLAQPLESYDLASLQSFGCGAAPVPPDVVREIERRIPSVEVREGYGCTETAAGLAVNPPDARRLGSVGRPLPGVEVRIVDDRDEDVLVGSPGEVCCRSRAVMAGYWGAPELTSEALRGGWFHTGDIGRLDEDGYLWIVDRKKDLIIRGGFNVFPRDVEDALLEHPAVAAAGVVGRPDERMGEEVVAFVVPRSGCELTPEDVVEFARTRLGGHRYPRDVRVVDRLPLTTVGKLDRKTLRERIAE